MNDTMLYAAAEALISRELGVDTVHQSDCESCFLYNDSYIEVKPSTYIQEKEPPYFDIRRSASKTKRSSDVCIFSVKNGCQWDFYIVKTSIIDYCFDCQPNVSLSLIEPIALHVKVGSIKQAVDVACSI